MVGLLFCRLSVEMSADQDFRKAVRSMYRFLKAFHHAYALQVAESQNRQPAQLVQMANQIATGVQPALPSLNTEWLIFGNARNWLHTGVDILKDHYGEALQEARAELLEASHVRWEEAWQVVIRWARHNLKTIRGAMIKRATATVTRMMTGSKQGRHCIGQSKTSGGTESVNRG